MVIIVLIFGCEMRFRYLHFPRSEDEWVEVSKSFHQWGGFNVLGALDGKHVPVHSGQGHGSTLHNYKGRFSRVCSKCTYFISQ